MGSATGRSESKGFLWSPVVTLFILYGVAQAATDIGHSIHEAVTNGEFDLEETVRQKLLLDELIFNGGSPEDPDEFRRMIIRAILYSGVPAAILARAIGVSQRSLYNYEEGSSIPYEHKRRGIIEKLREIILGL